MTNGAATDAIPAMSPLVPDAGTSHVTEHLVLERISHGLIPFGPDLAVSLAGVLGFYVPVSLAGVLRLNVAVLGVLCVTGVAPPVDRHDRTGEAGAQASPALRGAATRTHHRLAIVQQRVVDGFAHIGARK